MKKTLQFFAAILLTIGIFLSQTTAAFAQGKVFTLDELAKNDGLDGRPAYYAYQGVVYDVTDSPLWKLGKHFSHFAGRDLSNAMSGAPHGEDIVKSQKVVGTFSVASTAPALVASSAPVAAELAAPATETKSPWYAGRIKIAGLSLLAWTGILLAVTFVINFATCFALPWSHYPLPWAGSRPGADALDAVSVHKPWATIHKPFAWATVILGVIHGILGLLQLFGFYL